MFLPCFYWNLTGLAIYKYIKPDVDDVFLQSHKPIKNKMFLNIRQETRRITKKGPDRSFLKI